MAHLQEPTLSDPQAAPGPSAGPRPDAEVPPAHIKAGMKDEQTGLVQAEDTTNTGSDPESLSRVLSGPPYSAFSKHTKSWIIAMVTFSSFVSPMTANIYFPVLNPLAKDLGVSVAMINLTITTYQIVQGISPTIFGDLGDMAGRRPAFILAFTLYIFACLGLALQNNYAALLVLRALQSGGSSGTLALGYAVIADISSSAERGKYMGIVGSGINIGPTLGPVIGGILAQYLSWRAIFWFCVIFVGVWLVPYILSVPETCRNVVGNGSTPPQGWNMTLLDYLARRNQPVQDQSPRPERKLKIPNPLHALTIVFEKDMALILFYNSLLYVLFMNMCATLSTQFARIYRYNDLEIGLCFLPFGAGCCIAAVGQGYLLDWNYRRIASSIGFTINRRKGDDLSKYPIEKARIQPVFPILALGLVATVAYGWVLYVETKVPAPLVLQFVIGMCITGPFTVLNTLVVDLYPQAPATATAANNLVRCSMGAIGTAVIESMITGIGVGWSFTLLAALCAVFSPILFAIISWGPGWRAERKERKAKEAEK